MYICMYVCMYVFFFFMYVCMYVCLTFLTYLLPILTHFFIHSLPRSLTYLLTDWPLNEWLTDWLTHSLSYKNVPNNFMYFAVVFVLNIGSDGRYVFSSTLDRSPSGIWTFTWNSQNEATGKHCRASLVTRHIFCERFERQNCMWRFSVWSNSARPYYTQLQVLFHFTHFH